MLNKISLKGAIILLPFLLATNSQAHCSLPHDAYIGKNAYRVYDYSYEHQHRHIKKQRKPSETLAYTNPPANKIFNHPASGMKHAPYQDNVAVLSGTPRAYQQLGTSLFYGPYFYTPRDRDARPEWQVPN